MLYHFSLDSNLFNMFSLSLTTDYVHCTWRNYCFLKKWCIEWPAFTSIFQNIFLDWGIYLATSTKIRNLILENLYIYRNCYYFRCTIYLKMYLKIDSYHRLCKSFLIQAPECDIKEYLIWDFEFWIIGNNKFCYFVLLKILRFTWVFHCAY